MKKLVLLVLAAFALSVSVAAAQADNNTPPPTISGPAPPTQISSADVGPPTISLLIPICAVKKIAYAPVFKGKAYLQLTPTSSCQAAAGPVQSIWQWGGTTPKGWTLSGYDIKHRILLVPLRDIGHVLFSFSYGADGYWAKCGIAPNFKKYGYTGTQYCR